MERSADSRDARECNGASAVTLVDPGTLPLAPPERADQPVTVLASRELLAEMRDRWSQPVQAKAVELPSGCWELHFRRVGTAPSLPFDDPTIPEPTGDFEHWYCGSCQHFVGGDGKLHICRPEG